MLSSHTHIHIKLWQLHGIYHYAIIVHTRLSDLTKHCSTSVSTAKLQKGRYIVPWHIHLVGVPNLSILSLGSNKVHVYVCSHSYMSVVGGLMFTLRTPYAWCEPQEFHHLAKLCAAMTKLKSSTTPQV